MKMETVQAVDRAFQILEAIALAGEMTQAELVKLLKIGKASVSRLIYTLIANGYLEASGEGRYRLSMKLYKTGVKALERQDRMSLINSALTELNKTTGRVTQFSIEDSNQLLCIQSIGSGPSSFSIYTNVGRYSPLYCTSAGKAILAHRSGSEIVDLWEHLDVKPLTSKTFTNVQDLLKDIADTKQRGYALDLEESEYNLFCVGAAVIDHTSLPIGAISVSGNSLSPEEEADISSLVMAAARRVSSLLGYTGA